VTTDSFQVFSKGLVEVGVCKELNFFSLINKSLLRWLKDPSVERSILGLIDFVVHGVMRAYKVNGGVCKEVFVERRLNQSSIFIISGNRCGDEIFVSIVEVDFICDKILAQTEGVWLSYFDNEIVLWHHDPFVAVVFEVHALCWKAEWSKSI
jgi:hypothetical protein